MRQVNQSLVRVNDTTLRVVTPVKDFQLRMATQRDSVPYYKVYRRTLDLNSVHAWPLEVRRRFLFEFKNVLIPYVSRPSRGTRTSLTNALDIVISKAITRNRT